MEEAALNKERLELALEAAGLDLWENNLVTGEVTRKALKTFAELNYSDQEIKHHVDNMLQLVHPDDVEAVKTAVNDHLSGITGQYRCEFRLKAKNGSWVWYANYGRVMDVDHAKPGKRFIGVTFNIDDRKRKENELAQINRQLAEQNVLLQNLNASLQFLAANDSLTSLANRRTLMDMGFKEWKRAQRFQHPLSLLMVDIDLFKTINDTWGHLVGDEVICAVANTCKQRIRQGIDIASRWGGEEFVIVLPETDKTDAHVLAESLCRAVAAQHILVEPLDDKVTYTISIGVATMHKDMNLSFEQLLSNADRALYKAKEAGRNNVQG